MSSNQNKESDYSFDSLDLANVSSEDEEEHNMTQLINNISRRFIENPEVMQQATKHMTDNCMNERNNHFQPHKQQNK